MTLVLQIAIFLIHDDAMIPTLLMILMYWQINTLQHYKGYRTMHVIVVARALTQTLVIFAVVSFALAQ